MNCILVDVFTLSWNEMDCYKLLKYPLLIVVLNIICIYYNNNNNTNKNKNKIENNNNNDNIN